MWTAMCVVPEPKAWNSDVKECVFVKATLKIEDVPVSSQACLVLCAEWAAIVIGYGRTT